MKDGLFSDFLVVELASVLAGPSVGMFFAELGAKVIKVENAKAGGDVTRAWRLSTEPATNDRSAYFCSVNWGKKSIALDLSTDEGRKIVHRLVEKADLVLVSYKHGDAEKLQMDAKTLCSLNPRLIYAAINAYGTEDPRPGFDAIIQAEAGFTYMNGTPGGGPVKMPVALMDILAAHQLKEACLLALLERAQTGRGSVLNSSLIGAGLASLANQASNYLVAGHVPKRMGSEHPNIVPYGTIFLTKDGKEIVLAVGSDGQFTKLCEILGAGEWAQMPAYARNADRVKNRHALNALLAEKIGQRERDTLLSELENSSVPAGAVHDMQEALSLPAARELEIEGEGLKGLRTISFESGSYGKMALSAPPALGADTVEILQRYCGMADAEVSDLVDGKIVVAYGG